MLKQMTALLFLLLFAMQTFSRAFIVLDYYTNTKAFAKNCVNKSRPKMHCNGKCQMMKKLKQEEKKDEQLPERKDAGKNEIFSGHSFSFELPASFSNNISIAYPLFNADKISDMPRSIFRPPGF
jgi:hypothetical protein